MDGEFHFLDEEERQSKLLFITMSHFPPHNNILTLQNFSDGNICKSTTESSLSRSTTEGNDHKQHGKSRRY